MQSLHLFQQSFLAPEAAAPVDQIHPTAALRQQQAIQQGGVAAPHHCHILTQVQSPIACSAVGHSVTSQCLLPCKPQGTASGSGCQNQSPALEYPPVCMQGKAILPPFRPFHPGTFISGTCPQRLVVDPLCQIRPGDPIDARVVFHQGRIDNLSPVILLLQHQGTASSPGSIQRRRQPGDPPAGNQNLVHMHPSRRSMPGLTENIRSEQLKIDPNAKTAS